MDEDFPDDNTTSFNGASQSYKWAIFLQYPVLSYLDSQRKKGLFSTIAGLVRSGAVMNSDLSDLRGFSEDDLCIAEVAHYSVSEYEES